jgi:glycosyltransferase involved in cell wall biosynthesis
VLVSGSRQSERNEVLYFRILVNPKPKLLLIDIGAPFGGVETYLVSLCSLLQTRCDLFCICALPELAARLKPLGVHVICIPFTFNRWFKILRFLLAFPILLYLIARYRIQIVQVNGFLETVLILPAKLFGCLTVRSAHGPSEMDRYRWYKRPEMVFVRLVSLYCLRHASRIVCVSEAVYDDVIRIVPASRVSVVPNWVSHIPDKVPDRSVLGSPRKVLYVGRVEWYKGIDLLFDAARNIPDLQIVIAGQGSYRSQLEQSVGELNVSFEGFQSKIEPYYRSADVFVNPSRGPEGLPIASLEAMAYGTPCLFSDLEVHREISQEGLAACLFKRADASDLRERLQVLLSDSTYRQSIVEAARRLVIEKYSPQAALAGYCKAFGLN